MGFFLLFLSSFRLYLVHVLFIKSFSFFLTFVIDSQIADDLLVFLLFHFINHSFVIRKAFLLDIFHDIPLYSSPDHSADCVLLTFNFFLPQVLLALVPMDFWL